MSTAFTIQCAIDVTAVLNAAAPSTFAVSFTAERLYAPIYELDEGNDIAVHTTAVSREETFVNRSMTQGMHEVDVAILQRLQKPEDSTELDELMLLPDQISAYLKGDDTAGASRRILECGAKLVKVANRPIYDATALQTKQLLISVLTFTYQAHEAFR